MEENSQQKEGEYNTLSIVAFILAFVFPPIGFILGIIALSHIKKTNEKGRGLAIAAIVLGAIFFLFLIFMVFIGILWVVIRNVVVGGDNIYEGEEQLDLNSMCLESEVRATEVESIADNNFLVTLQRTGGDAELGGVKLVFTNADEQTSYPVDVPGSTYPLAALATITVPVTVPIDTLLNPNKVSVVVYFIDESGKEKLCPTATQLAFNL